MEGGAKTTPKPAHGLCQSTLEKEPPAFAVVLELQVSSAHEITQQLCQRRAPVPLN